MSAARARDPTCIEPGEVQRMRMTCPYCGSRGLAEFTQSGDATPSMPKEGADATAWVDFVYFRDNPRGTHAELWQHVLGCRTWLVVTRDTASHEVIRVEPAAEARMRR